MGERRKARHPGTRIRQTAQQENKKIHKQRTKRTYLPAGVCVYIRRTGRLSPAAPLLRRFRALLVGVRRLLASSAAGGLSMYEQECATSVAGDAAHASRLHPHLLRSLPLVLTAVACTPSQPAPLRSTILPQAVRHIRAERRGRRSNTTMAPHLTSCFSSLLAFAVCEQ